MDDDVIIASAALIIINEEETRKRPKRKRRWWTTTLFKSRKTCSESQLMTNLQVEMEYGLFNNFCRMSAKEFEWLLNAIGPEITKQNTNYREAIPTKERLAITLRFLASGDSYTSLSHLFKISKQAISSIVPDVCKAVIKSLQNYIKVPSDTQQWKQIAETFSTNSNFPQCIGALDGKYCASQNPIHGNYKSDDSIVLMGIVDADYCFIYVNVGCQGRIGVDGGVFENTPFYKQLQDNELHLPKDDVLPYRKMKIPFVFVADNAFPLQKHIMKPYLGNHGSGSVKRIFNYRLSRARGIAENAFGIISSVFRVLRKPMLLQPERASTVIMTCLYLHNFLRKNKISRDIYTPQGSFDRDNDGIVTRGTWRIEDLTTPLKSYLPLRDVPRTNSLANEEVRTEFAEYFATIGQVPWQNMYA
ncbi:hypothetical protein GWI33_015079 [Rhynchophorus ferrugineus]|uniref:DDE Tnp4 domain-containing protein n=1 Tax=Rhynchophorus ferrugineus TaxID=354439 RepID=A0A834MA39_RHYFE|nr:hypothetical protein GWI33_015079 [Rhynchophorus ferrugineus]